MELLDPEVRLEIQPHRTTVERLSGTHSNKFNLISSVQK